MKKFISSVLVCLVLLLFLPVTGFASSDFSTGYNVNYSVSENSNTHAVMQVDLANKTSEYFASSYKIEVGFQHIQNVQANDSLGPITPIVTQTKEGNIIALTFNKHVVGINNSLHFTLSFDTPDIAQKLGSIWEINIPGITNQDDFTNFNVNVIVPKSFANASYIKPEQLNNNLSFTKEQLGKSGISIAFGEKQIYAFSLKYHLQNKNVFPVNSEIALPPNTNYQTVFIDTMNPRPNNVIIDKDGNWLAQYTLLPSKKIDVTVTGQTQLSLYPEQEILSNSMRADYLLPRPYWQTNNKNIIEIAKTLKTPQEIYDYVVNTLRYDFSRIGGDQTRLGAADVLSHPDRAVCLEFTDLFIALSRASGIPAREIDGFAYTENAKERPVSLLRDVLHAWPEYYDSKSKMWIMVDPTWGNTTGGVDYFHTLDFDHVAFVIKGEDSEYPIPAGGYKLDSNQNSKDIDIRFTNLTETVSPEVSIASNFPSFMMSAFPLEGNINIVNTGHSLVDTQDFLVTSNALTPKSQKIETPQIPPFGQANTGLTFRATSFLTNQSFIFTIHAGNQAIDETIHVSPLSLSKKSLIIGGIGVLFTIFIFVIAGKTRRLLVSKRR